MKKSFGRLGYKISSLRFVTIPLFSHADATDLGMLKTNRRHLDLLLLIVGISFVYVEETAPLGEGCDSSYIPLCLLLS